MYKKSKKDILSELEVDIKNGLSEEQYHINKEKYGENKLKEEKKVSIIKLFFKQLQDVMIYVLLIASVITVIAHWPHGFTDAAIILIVVLINAFVGMIQEYKAGKAIEALKKMNSPRVIVRRKGHELEVDASDLVVGDIVILDAGKFIPADIRLISSVNLQVDESALTGESLPVEKDSEYATNEDNLPIADMKNICFMSTLITNGKAEGVVIAVGMQTEIGKIAQILIDEENGETPLQQKLNKLGKILGYGAIIICAFIFLLGIIEGNNILDMFITSISLAVAAIPEGLVAIVAIVLTIGVTRMSKNNAIVKRLPAVETLGSVNIICSDKTGTLTQNKMTVVEEYILEKENITYQNMYLCSDVVIQQNGDKLGDPTEIALVDYAMKMAETNDFKYERVGENTFDSDRKLMSTINKLGDNYRVYVKGALESILKITTRINDNGTVRDITKEDIQNISNKVDEMSNNALRVLAFAYKDEITKIENSELEKDLIFSGIVGMIDPPRESVKSSIEATHKAGIDVVMITGDHRNTAYAIAKELKIATSSSQVITGQEINEMTDEEFEKNIENYRVFARVSPEHKVRIVKALKKKEKIVSMTGDGVNDAPSLKIADIGVAMGITGTDVSKSASSMILLDDNFSTIVKAIEEGRNIYNNIKKTILFLLTCNLGEVISILFAVLLKWPIPLLATQILWINLVTDTLPALALGVDSPDKDVMLQSPRSKDESFFSNRSGIRVVVGGLLIGILTPLAFYIGIHTDGSTISNHTEYALMYGRTMAFLVLILSQIFYTFTIRSDNKSILENGIFSNKYLNISIIIVFILQAGLLYIPFLSRVFSLTMLSLKDFAIVIVFSITTLIINEIIKKINNKRRNNG